MKSLPTYRYQSENARGTSSSGCGAPNEFPNSAKLEEGFGAEPSEIQHPFACNQIPMPANSRFVLTDQPDFAAVRLRQLSTPLDSTRLRSFELCIKVAANGDGGWAHVLEATGGQAMRWGRSKNGASCMQARSWQHRLSYPHSHTHGSSGTWQKATDIESHRNYTLLQATVPRKLLSDKQPTPLHPNRNLVHYRNTNFCRHWT